MNKDDKKTNSLFSILINIVIPIVILTQFSGEEYLGPKIGFIIALSLPFIYGIRGYKEDKKINFFSGLGVLSILLTGIIGLFELSNSFLAFKEASIPFIVAIIIIISQIRGYSILKKILEGILNFEKIFKVAKKKKVQKKINQKIKISNYLLATVFFVSAITNFIITKIIVISSPGTITYNNEIGILTGISFAVIFVPFIIIFTLIVTTLIFYIKNKTGIKIEKIIK